MKGFAYIQVLGTLVTLFMALILWGVPLAPGILLFSEVWNWRGGVSGWLDALIFGLAIATSFIFWGIGLLLLSGLIQRLLSLNISEERRVPIASVTTVRWALTAICHRLTTSFLFHIIPSFFGNWYYRLCGCHIAIGAQVNSPFLYDSYAVKVGKNAVIGGGATINCHLVEDGHLVLSPVSIGEGATIGGQSAILPGSSIGKNSIVAYNAVVTKRTIIPDGEVWGGIPARKIR